MQTLVAAATLLLASAGLALPQNLPFVEDARFRASDGLDGDQLGFSVALSGGLLAAGAPFDDEGGSRSLGAAYVYVRSGSSWSTAIETAKLTASDGMAHDQLGIAIAAAGDTVAVGAPRVDIGSHADQGAVYVYVKPTSGWTTMTETAKLTASDGVPNSDFGRAVAMDGDTIVVGAPAATGSGTSAVYVFEKPPAGWTHATETAKLTMAVSNPDEWLGSAVSISGDTIVAGAPTSNVVPGAAYVFVRAGSTWVNATETARLTSIAPSPTSAFGRAVGVDGGTIAVSDFFATIGGGPAREGAVFVYEEPPGGWANTTQVAALTMTNSASANSMGRAVAVDGNLIFATAELTQIIVGSNCVTTQGAALVYQQPESGWVDSEEDHRLVRSEMWPGGGLFMSVSTDNENVALGFPESELGPVTPGAAFAFEAPYAELAPTEPVPVVTGVTPSVVANATLPSTVTLTGTDLGECGTTVTVDGTPAAVSSSGPTFLNFSVPSGLDIGPYSVVVHSPLTGSSNSIDVSVGGSHPSVLTGPQFNLHRTTTTASYTAWTDAGWNALFVLSAVHGTTALPGIVSFEIGGGSFGNLVAVITQQADATGFIDLPVTMPGGLPVPFTLYWECLTYDPAVPLGLQAPLETSNAIGVLTFN